MLGQNQILFSDIVMNYTLADLLVNQTFINTANRDLQVEWGQLNYMPGSTVAVRRRNFVNIQRTPGPVNFQPIQEQQEFVTFGDFYSGAFSYSMAELTLAIADGKDIAKYGEIFYKRYIRPHLLQICAEMDYDIARQAAYDLVYFQGTPGVPINSFGPLATAQALMNNVGVLNNEMYLAINNQDSAQLMISQQNAFNTMLNTEISEHGRLGRLGSMDILRTAGIYRQIAGDFGVGPITLTQAFASGNTLQMTGLTPNAQVFNKGDAFSVAGAKITNPLLRSADIAGMPDIQFCVAQDTLSDGGGNATVVVNQNYISAPGDAYRNMSDALQIGAVVTPVGSHNVNVVYVRDSLTFMLAPLPRLNVPYSSTITSDIDKNINMSFNLMGDVTQFVNSGRIDALPAFKWHPQYAVKLIS